jgi:hypothetical protein
MTQETFTQLVELNRGWHIAEKWVAAIASVFVCDI